MSKLRLHYGPQWLVLPLLQLRLHERLQLIIKERTPKMPHRKKKTQVSKKSQKEASQAKRHKDHEAEEQLDLYDETTLERLSGLQHNNLRAVAEGLHIRVGARGKTIHLSGPGEEVRLAHRLFTQLGKLAAKGREFSARDVAQALAMLRGNPEANIYELFSDTVFKAKTGKQVTPKGPGQKAYIEAIRAHDMTFGVGPAGTGKTYLAMTVAVADLLAERVSRIILTRPAVEAGEKLGFLPGNLEEKVLPYLRPLYDAMFDLLGRERAEELVAHGVIEVAPLAFMRGRTLNDAFVILDEAQNTTREQIKMFLTRLGFGSKMVITGDITQIDLPIHTGSGLVEAIHVLKNIPDIAVCIMTEKDVVRHHLVQSVVRAYEATEQRQ
jgi:phosphate starvation-inducible PhoH-like protein